MPVNIVAKTLRVLLCAALALLMCGVPVSCLLDSGVTKAQAEVTAVSNVAKFKLKAYPVSADGDEVWEVDAKKDNATKEISSSGGRLRICAVATLEDGSSVPEYMSEDWAELAGVDEGFEYTWDGDAVTVSSTGVITALKDGVTKITATPENEDLKDKTATIEIETLNQGEGFIVSKVSIVNAKGKAYGDDAIKLTESKGSIKLYCSITYKNKQTKDTRVVSNYPGAPSDEKPSAGELDNLSWTLSDSQYASVAKNSQGVATVKGLAAGVIYVRCSITGGDASKSTGMGKGVVFDKVTLSIDNGKTINSGDPASKLTVNVVYEKDLDKIAVSKTYTKKEFAALGAVKRSYTLTRNAGKYATDTAYGVPIATLLAKLKIDVDDIRYFTLKANDGANPGKISATWLLKKTRYYFPNYDLGGSKQEAKQVPSMLALEDSWSDNSTETGSMNSGTCFRLVFGSATSNDGATDKSIKFINTFTIVLAGGAPSEHGKEKEPSGGGGGGKGQGNGTGDGTGKDSGDGSGKGDANGTQGGGSVGDSENSNNEGDVDNSNKKVESLVNENAWSIRQMMNKNNSAVSVVYEDPNLIPAAVAVTVIVILGAGLARYLVFRRRLK